MKPSLQTDKSIVFVNQSSGYLMIDIINARGEEGVKRELLAGMVNPRGVQLDGDVIVRKIIPYKRTSVTARLIPWLVGFIQILIFVKFRRRNSELFLVSNPPLAPLLPLFCRNRFSLLIYDVFPDTLVEKGVFKSKSPVVRWWQRSNRKIFHRASQIVTLSQGMKSVLSQYIEADRIKVVPLWSDNEFIRRIPDEQNVFLEEQELAGKFIVMYSGNLGATHNLEIIIELARGLQTNTEIFFLIIGSGQKYQSLEQEIARHDLPNLRLLPWQDTDLLPYTLSAADLGIVSLDPKISRLSVPSKTFDLLSAGVPILGIAGEESELNRIILDNEIGACFQEDSLEDIIDFISSIASDRKLHYRYSENALTCSKRHSPENAKLFFS